MATKTIQVIACDKCGSHEKMQHELKFSLSQKASQTSDARSVINSWDVCDECYHDLELHVANYFKKETAKQEPFDMKVQAGKRFANDFTIKMQKEDKGRSWKRYCYVQYIECGSSGWNYVIRWNTATSHIYQIHKIAVNEHVSAYKWRQFSTLSSDLALFDSIEQVQKVLEKIEEPEAYLESQNYTH